MGSWVKKKLGAVKNAVYSALVGLSIAGIGENHREIAKKSSKNVIWVVYVHRHF